MKILWLAVTLKGVMMFPDHQLACAAADGQGVRRVYRVEVYNRPAKDCCKQTYASFGFIKACEENPGQWDCGDEEPKFMRMDCSPTPSYTVTESKNG